MLIVLQEGDVSAVWELEELVQSVGRVDDCSED